MLLNAGKCNYMCLGRNTANAVRCSIDETLVNSKEETKFGYKRDNEFLSIAIIRSYVKKTSQNLSALCRYALYLDSSQKNIFF